MPDSTALRRSPLSVAIAAVLLLTACSSTGRGTPVATRAAAAVHVAADPVGALLVDDVADVADGFTRQPERTSHTGATDLAEAIRADGHSGARVALTSAGFQHGYQLLWTNSAGDVIGVQVYRFATASGARRDYARDGRLAAHQAEHVTRYRVGAHPSGEVRGAEVDVEGNVTEQVIGVSGRDVMQVVCTSRTAAGLRSRAMALAGRQFDRMSRGPRGS